MKKLFVNLKKCRFVINNDDQYVAKTSCICFLAEKILHIQVEGGEKNLVKCLSGKQEVWGSIPSFGVGLCTIIGSTPVHVFWYVGYLL